MMPIRHENRARYLGGSPQSKQWKAWTKALLAEVGHRCEGSPAYPDCRAVNHAPHPVTGSHTVLTIAHLDHYPENNERANLRAWCQRCHNTFDAPMRAAGIRARRLAALATPELFACEPVGSGEAQP